MRAVASLALIASPALAQQHDGHAAHATQQQAEPGADAPMDHSQMHHAGEDHAAMSPVEPARTPAEPVTVTSDGPARAADNVWGAEAMAESRAALARENGGMTYLFVQGERLEYRLRDGKDGYLWDAQGWYGGDIDKLWLKSEGEGAFGESPEQAEVQALWSHAIGPWFDVQAGVRQDIAGAQRTHAVLGVQGLVPYEFEVDAAAFLSSEGELTARIEAELDQRITQRLILQPRVEVNFAAQDVPEAGIGAGLDSVEAGLRLRYEIVPELAPYIGVAQEWRTGGSAAYARAEGEDVSSTSLVAGVRFWF